MLAEAWAFGDDAPGRRGAASRAGGGGSRRLLVAAIVLGCVTALVVAALLAAPAIVRSRIEARLARAGLVAQIAGVELGWEGLVLRGLDVGLPPERPGLRAVLDEVRLDRQVVRSGGTAVVRGGALRVDLGSRHLRRLLRRLGGPARAREPGEGITWRASGLTLGVRDAEGELVAAGELSAERDAGGAVRCALRDVRLGRGTLTATSMLAARRATGDLEVSLAQATLKLSDTSDLGPARALRRRVLDGVRVLRGATRSGAGARASLPRWRFGTRDGRVLVADRALAEDITLAAEGGGAAGTITLRATASAGSAPDAVDVDLTLEPTRETARGNVRLAGLPLAVVAPLLPDLPWHHPDSSFLRGHAAITTSSDGRTVEAEGRLEVTNLGLSSPRLGARPFAGLDLEIAGRATLEPASGRVRLGDVSVGLGRVTVRASGSLRSSSDGWGVDLDLRMPQTRCADAFAAMPPAITEDLYGFAVEGTIDAHVVMGIDSNDLDATRLDLDFRDRCQAVSGGAFADVTRFRTPFQHRVAEPDGVMREMVLGPGTAEWVPIDRMSGFLLHAVLAREDAGFFRHRGFAPAEIRHALVRNLRAGRYVYGASTITMQLVKNVFLRREKTLARKIQEAILTWYVEHVLDKRTILELYLNVIEFGPGVYGIGPAAEHYFGRRPDELTPAEAVFLATILPSPRERHRMWEAGALTPEWRELVHRVLRRLERAHRIDRRAFEHGMRDPVAFHRPGDPPVAERDLSGLSWSRLPVGMVAPVARVVPGDDGMGEVETGGEGNELAPSGEGSLRETEGGLRVRPSTGEGRLAPSRGRGGDSGDWIEEDDTSVDATDE